MTCNWSKTLNGRILKSLPFIWYVTWHGIQKRSLLWSWRSHFRSNDLQLIKTYIRRSKTEVITIHLIYHMTCDTKVIAVVMEVTFSVMVRSNDLQLVLSIERSNTWVITFHLYVTRHGFFYFFLGHQTQGPRGGEVTRPDKTGDSKKISRFYWIEKIYRQNHKKSQQTKSGPPPTTESAKWYTPF